MDCFDVFIIVLVYCLVVYLHCDHLVTTVSQLAYILTSTPKQQIFYFLSKLSSQVQRHRTSYRAPSAALHPWTVLRRPWKHFCLHLIYDCTVCFHYYMHRIFSIGLYGALESVTVLRCLRSCRDIIIIMTWYILVVLKVLLNTNQPTWTELLH